MSKTVLACGVSSGLGQVVAEHLRDAGFSVFGTMRDPSGAPPTTPFPVVPMDVTSEESVAACLEEVTRQAGRIDVVINCFNEMILGTVEETPMKEVESLYDVNLFGVIRVCRQVLPIMRRQGGGTIINMSSLGGLLAVPHLSAYTSAKFAIEAFSEALYHELRGEPIDVVIMQPVAMRMDRPEVGSHLKPAQNLPADSATHRMIARMGQDSRESGLTPQAVAEEIQRVILLDKKPLRRPMDRAKALTWVKRLAPQAVIDRMIAGLLGG
jgi:NAD(P)-dependent dehydrogenase (short-subunit alcohol dehydrogenase family)